MTTRRAHPQKELLLRFLRGEATLAGSREVVRHLLSGCPECLALTRPVWERADGFTLRPARRRRDRARAQEGGDVIEEARAELLAVVTDLRAIRQRLKRVRASLPISTQESSREDLDAEPDVATEMRAVIGNGLNDSLRPLINDLLGAAGYKLRRAGQSDPNS